MQQHDSLADGYQALQTAVQEPEIGAVKVRFDGAASGLHSHCRYCRSAAPPSRFSWVFNGDAEGVSAF